MAFSGKTESGFVHIVNTVVKIIHAIIRFIKTQPAKINNLFQNLAEINQSFAKKSFASFGSSHFNLQNHHRGIKFRVYSVHFLSVASLHIFGGIHIPNSTTFTPDLLAVIKCQSSCKITKTINISIHNKIDRIMFFLL